MTMVVNGRFLRVRPTGMHRAARTLLLALADAGFPYEVWAPAGVEDPLITRTVRGLPAGRVADHVWEQGALAAAAVRRPLLNPINTAPFAHPKSLLWTHDLGPLVGPEWFQGARAYGMAMLGSVRRARFVFVPSDAVKQEVVDRGVRADRVAVLRSPVDPVFGPVPDEVVAEVRRRHGLDHRPYLLHLGWADPRKNISTVATAHLRLVGDVPHDLVLAGREHPIFAPVDLPAAGSIKHLGYLRDGDLPALMAGAAAFVFPSLYEGFGLPPIEAMACGTPALVSDLPVLRESTWGLATFVPARDVDAWAEAIREALRSEDRAPALPRWTAADLADQFVRALPSWARAAP
jgi:glycosyltransferase involved in cell wall biosynthesis